MSDDPELPAAASDDLAKLQADCRQLIARAYEGRALVPGEDDELQIGDLLDVDAPVQLHALGQTAICYLRVDGEIVDTLVIDLYRSAMQLTADILSRVGQHTGGAAGSSSGGRYHR